eukprot:704836-Hanusia_phi.AAC.6
MEFVVTYEDFTQAESSDSEIESIDQDFDFSSSDLLERVQNIFAFSPRSSILISSATSGSQRDSSWMEIQ